jgi:ankyrin repeat protein
MKQIIRCLVLALQLCLITAFFVSAGELENSLLTETNVGSNPAKIKELVEKGANVNAREGYLGHTALIHASTNKNKGFSEVVRFLIEKGADVNAFDKNGYTPLISAAMYGLLDSVQTLIEKGADVNARNNDGVRALTYAAMYGHTDVVRLLIKNGANVSAKDDMNQTALSMSQFMKNQKDTSEGHKKALNDIIGILEQAGAR